MLRLLWKSFCAITSIANVIYNISQDRMNIKGNPIMLVCNKHVHGGLALCLLMIPRVVQLWILILRLFLFGIMQLLIMHAPRTIPRLMYKLNGKAFREGKAVKNNIMLTLALECSFIKVLFDDLILNSPEHLQ